MLKNKKAIVFGERDDISGETAGKCLRAAGAEIIYESTACFVWTAAGAVGLAVQEEVKNLAEKFGTDSLIVVLGINQLSTIDIMTRTFKNGDPSYAGPLAGVALGLNSYHILELKEDIPADVWDQEMAIYELEIEEDMQESILKTMKEARQG